MIRKAASLIALSLLILPACGDNDDDDKNDNVVEEIPTNYIGLYKTDCIASTALDLSHSIRTVDIQADGGFSRTEEYFGDEACQDSGLALRVDGTVQEKGDLPENPQLDMLNFSVNDVYITVNSDTLKDVLNTTRFCGITDWAVGQERNVAGADCRGFAIKKGDVIQEVVDDREGTLYFGKNFALLLNQTSDRPTEIDDEVPYHKQ
ncbi:hypothetical protein [Oligoflexus tunisiensis]|uniref:hypothetical protein n=1 Tax=Oligoflexus tunisiensis TaxID=708132 RepID=UPI00114CF968|nr:hypothetical protein [Oligoflexus tunisiensis]